MKTPFRGIPIVISGPSGVGKSTICQLLLERYPDLGYSISATTRPPRGAEQDGVDYYFVDRATFEKWISSDKLIEYAEVYGNLYGTPRHSIDGVIDRGMDVLLDIDVQGGDNMRRLFSTAVLIYLLPPSYSELEKRLRLRKTDRQDIVDTRLKKVCEELKSASYYDYVVINEALEKTLETVRSIIIAERFRRERFFHILEESGYDLFQELGIPVSTLLTKDP